MNPPGVTANFRRRMGPVGGRVGRPDDEHVQGGTEGRTALSV
ncbi:hypothetical protein BN2537_5431 [Streptomyces venezuelae]|nr:hypothetical protein BN2537_5431 [Streptomyces venezuelae]